MTSTPTADLTVWWGLSAWPCSGEGQGELEAPITLRSTPHDKCTVVLPPSSVPFSYTPILHSKTGHHDQQPCKPLFCSQGNYRKVYFYSWLSERNCFYDNTAIILCAAFTFCFLFPFSVIYSAGEKHINFLCMLWAFLPSRDQISMQWAGALQNWHRSGKISTAICRKQGSNEIALSCYGCNLGNLSLSHTLENNNHKTHNK